MNIVLSVTVICGLFLGHVHSIFDPRTQEQDYGNNFIDVDDTPVVECPENFSGQIPYAMDCRQYLNCWRGRGTIQSCSPGTTFNPRTMECDHPSKVKCKTFDNNALSPSKNTHGRYQRQQQIPAARCESGASGLFAHPVDCTKFLNCDHGRTFIQECGPGTLFNDLFKVCDWPHNVDCGIRVVGGFPEEAVRTTTERYRGDYGQGLIDARMDPSPSYSQNRRYDTIQPNRNNQRFPINDIRNQRRYPDAPPAPQQSNNNIDPFSTSFSSPPAQFANSNANDNPPNIFLNRFPPSAPSNIPNLQNNSTPFNTVGSQQGNLNNNSRASKSYPQNNFESWLNPVGAAQDNYLGPIRNEPKNELDDTSFGRQFDESDVNTNQSSDGDSFGDIEDPHLAEPTQKQLFHQSLQSFDSNTLDSPYNQAVATIENQPSKTDEEIQSNVRQQHPELSYLSPRTMSDFEKYFMKSHPTTPATEIVQTTTEQVIPLRDNSKRVQSVYPSGFETLGSKCEELGSDLNPHPYDCSKFVSCEYGKMTVQSCDAGFLFNPVLKMCDFWQNVKNCTPNVPQSPQNATDNFDLRFDEPTEDQRKVHDVPIQSSPPKANGQQNTNKFPIPDMSVLPLSNEKIPQYPVEPQTPTNKQEVPYSGVGKPSNGGDIQPESLDEVIKRLSSGSPVGQWNRVGNEYVYTEPKPVIPLSTTTEKPHVMKIPPGKEHVMPIYQRRTTTSRPTTTTTPKQSLPLQNFNQIYYKPFSNPPSNVEQDYIPVSEALKMLLRPYLNANQTSEAPNNRHIAKVEDKILDMMDEKKNIKSNHTSASEQESLASAVFSDNVEVENLPPSTLDADAENLFKPTRTTTETPKNENQPNDPHHFAHSPNRPTHHHNPKPHFGSKPPSSPDFKHSPEFHERFNIPYPPSNAKPNNPSDFSKPDSNRLNFPGPTNHNLYNQPYGRHYQSPSNHEDLPPPPMTHTQNYRNRYPHHHSNPHHSSQHRDVEHTTPITASAPVPRFHPDADQRTTLPSHFSRAKSQLAPTCDDQFDCNNNDICIPFSKLCDGRNDCGNRYDELNCPHVNYQVRLSNDKGHKHMGRVEVRAFGKWGYVCDDKFTMTDANVLCRELGFNMGAAEVKPNSFYPPNANMPSGETIFMMDEVKCSGNETSLKDCDFDGWGVSDCNAEEVVGVVCKVTVMKCPPNHWLCQTSEECIPMSFMCDGVRDCTDGTDESQMHCNAKIEYRLMDGNELEGRVEVKYRGVWGTVCDDDFRDIEAGVFCKSLGFNGPATILKRKHGMSTGPIWLDQVNCLGNETALDKCMHFEWSESNCNHTEDVSVRCSYGSDAKSAKYIADDSALQRLTNSETGEYLRELQRSSKSVPDYSNNCGKVKVDAAEEDSSEMFSRFRVISGQRTKRGHHPWQATIRARGRNGKSSHWCGAVVISKNHILTAAHCLIGFPKGAYFVRLGDHHSEIHENSEVEIFIENWYIHEEFRKGQLMNNDIAVILLKSPIQFTNYIQPICLPTKETPYTPNKNCTISGWGSIQYGKSTPSLDLKAASVPIIAQDICRKAEIYGDDIMDTMFCAGYLDSSSVDACDGDSGGPLVCADDDGVNSLYGLISWGQRCGDTTKPGVYVKVAKYLDWIKDKMYQLS